MHYNSERVQQWRRKTKELLVDLLGGRCVICRYNKCVSALEFHHVFADEKKDTLARMLANPQSINKILDEIEKCVLLCSNCHKEHHYIENFSLEKYLISKVDRSAFQTKIKKEATNPCKVCGKLTLVVNTTCSRNCAALLRYPTKYDNYDIINLIDTKKETFRSLANKLEVSDVAVRKRYKKLKYTGVA